MREEREMSEGGRGSREKQKVTSATNYFGTTTIYRERERVHVVCTCVCVFTIMFVCYTIKIF